jgi:5-(carboxyamino)imidazole ribonucleotide synthase
MSTALDLKIGILGGGQLGRMLIQAGIDFNLNFQVLDPDPSAPCQPIAQFTVGNLSDYETVVRFGEGCDLITVEIENVNTKALKHLETIGKRVFPQPHLIELIQDKRSQKKFFKENNIPTADFVLVNNQEDINNHHSFLPAVNKLATEGYDGRGVSIIRSQSDIPKGFDKPGLLEKLVPFEKEIAVIVARNEVGDIVAYPAVEMVFHPEKNLVEYLYSPAELLPSVALEAQQVAKRVIEKLKLVGLLAVEMFVLKDGKALVNEIAPRPHNSGHQTIEANVTSQYNQHLRAILGLPLGATTITYPSAMLNILGEPNFTGNAVIEGLEEVLNMKGVYIHLYGKKTTKPFRKMGHVTIVDETINGLRAKAMFIKQTLKIKA